MMMYNSNNLSRRRGTSSRGGGGGGVVFMDNKKDKKKWLYVVVLLGLFWYMVWYKSSVDNTTSSSKVMRRKKKKSSGMMMMEAVRKMEEGLEEEVVQPLYDLVGYGRKQEPRLCVVMVSSSSSSSSGGGEDVWKAMESLMEHTDRNRIFVVCAVLEGSYTETEKRRLQQRAKDMNDGKTLHWHGDEFHSHNNNSNDSNSNNHSSSKIVLLFRDDEEESSSSGGDVGMARKEGVEFIQVLAQKHKDAKLMDDDESLMLMFVRPDARFIQDHWLDVVTDALLPRRHNTHAAPISAVSLPAEEDISMVLSLNDAFDVVVTTTQPSSLTQQQLLEEQQQGDDGTVYKKTPILLGPATAMLLSTYTSLPLPHLPHIHTHMDSDVQLSLSLWLCANGIHVLSSQQQQPLLLLPTTTSDYSTSSTTLTAAAVPHFLSTYIANDQIRHQIAQRRIQNNPEEKQFLTTTTSLLHQQQQQQPLTQCQTFDWFIQNVNTQLTPLLQPPPSSSRKKDQDTTTTTTTTTTEKKKPLVELRPLNLDIVSRPKMYDLEFVDAAKGFQEHPHLGAKDEQGNFGYVHDETALAKTTTTTGGFHISPEQKEQYCNKNDATKKMLTEQVSIDMTAHQLAQKQMEQDPIHSPPRAKIFCTVYTISKNHHKLQSILDTWGPKCDGFMVASDKTVPKLHTVEIPHEGPEEYNNIWQKVRSIWSYVYDHYYDKYDWFHIGGDDLYLLVENLRLYLESEEIQTAANGGIYLPNQHPTTQAKPMFLGRRFKEGGNEERIFNSGGSGYTLNKAALKALVVDAFPVCMPHLKTFAEDVMVAQCLRNKINTFPYDTKDEHGSERYMPFQPGHHYTYHPGPNADKDWYVKYSIDVKWGKEHSSKHSVAFHYIDPDLMKRMHTLLYEHC